MASASAGGGNQVPQAMAALLPRRAAPGAAAGDNNNKSSAFSLTCSRLSQYLKEKGTRSLGGIGFDIARPFDAATNKATTRPETPRTMNLLPGIDSSSNAAAAVVDTHPPNKPTAAAALPPPTQQQQQLLPTPAAALQLPPRGAQMTIFYGGKVIVFDNYPADKAKEILALAGRGGTTAPQNPQGSPVPLPPQNCAATAAATPLPLAVKPVTTQAAVASPAADPMSATAAAATVVTASPAIVVAPVATAPPTAAAPVSQKPPQIPLSSDLPIARRVSLNRFLEKRKDRINSKAPYLVNAASSSDAKPVPDKDNKQQPPMMEKDKQPQQQQSWLGLAPSDSL